MHAMGMLPRPAVVQTPMVEPPLVNMASSIANESRKHAPEQTPTYISKLVGDSTLKEELSVEGPWHNWQMPEEASGTEVATVAQWQGQEHPLCPLALAVVTEPHHADSLSLVAPSI